MLAQNFHQFQTFRNNSPPKSNIIQQGVQTGVTCNIQQNWELFTNNVDGPFSRGLKEQTV